MIEIGKIHSGFTKVYCSGEIEKVGEPRTVKLKTGGENKVAEATLKDSTGSITLQLWGAEIPMVKAGSKVEIENGYTSSYNGKTRLNIGKYGKLKVESF